EHRGVPLLLRRQDEPAPSAQTPDDLAQLVAVDSLRRPVPQGLAGVLLRKRLDMQKYGDVLLRAEDELPSLPRKVDRQSIEPLRLAAIRIACNGRQLPRSDAEKPVHRRPARRIAFS